MAYISSVKKSGFSFLMIFVSFNSELSFSKSIITSNESGDSTYLYVEKSNSSSNKFSSEKKSEDSESEHIVAPDAPANVVATPGRNKIVLSWDANTESDIDLYKIYKASFSNLAQKTLIDSTNSTTYTDTDVIADSTYYYYITAKNTGGEESVYSAEVTAIPLPDVLSEHTEITADINNANYLGASEWGDYDNDGDLDLINIGQYGTYLYKNLGNDSFESVSNSFIYGFYGDLEWGDYDNDGDLDIIILNRDYTRLYRNNGNGSFTYVQAFLRAAYGSVTFGDFDNDGDLDVLLSGGTTTSTSSAETNIYENNGNGGFSLNSTAGNVLLGGMYGTSKWADINNDGFLDVVVSGRRSTSYITRAYLNNGDKTFTYKQNLEGLWYSDIELGDIDNDGDLDLVISGRNSSNSNITTLYTNDGTGVFETSTSFPGAYQGDIELIDYDNDGDLDFTLSGRTVATQVYSNDGTGNWSLDISLPLFEYSSLSWGDYNSDGDLDLAITGRANGSYTTVLYKNTPDITGTNPSMPSALSDSSAFGKHVLSWDPSTDVETGPLHYNVSVFNVNTSKLVLSAMSDTTNGFRLIQREGNARNKTSIQLDYSAFIPGSYSWKVQAIDGSAKVSDFGTGSFTLTSIPFGLAYFPSPGITRLEWNKLEESDVDFYSIYQETDSTVVPTQAKYTSSNRYISIESLSSDTSYYFYVTSTNLSGQESGLSDRLKVNPQTAILIVDSNNSITDFSDAESEWVDFDNDGDLDLSITGSTSAGYKNNIYVNESGFSEANVITIPYSNRELAWGDYDNDGDQDLLVGGSDTHLYINKGNNVFERDLSVPFGLSSSGDIVWGDYDADGDLDVLFMAYLSGTSYTYLYLNNGKGSFTLSPASATIKGVYSGNIVNVDVNNDGSLDVLVTGYNRDNNITTLLSDLYINDGNGGFNRSAASDTLVPVYSSSVAPGDYDGDGDIDLFITGRTPSNGSLGQLYINDGTGSFNTSNIEFIGTESGSASWGDYDGDDDLDLMVSGNNVIPGQLTTKKTRLYINDGNGQLSESSLILENKSFANLSWGDYDGDRDLDLILMGYNEENTRESIFYNNVFSQGSGTSITAPTNLRTTIKEDTLTLYWDRPVGYDNEALTYNVYLKNSDVINTDTLSTPMASLSSGFRKVVESGNSGTNTFYKLITSDIPDGSYNWGVQTINSRFSGGAFSTNSSFAFNDQLFSFTTELISGYKDTTLTFDDSFIKISEYFRDSTLTISADHAIDRKLFIDRNSNRMFDASDVSLKDTTISFPFSEGDTLRYYASTMGIDSLTFYIGLGEINNPDSLKIGIPIMQATPELAGNSNEDGWYLLANPFTTPIGEFLSNIWTQGAINSNAPSGSPTLFTFNEQTATYTAITGDLNADTLESGVGILAYIFEDDIPTDGNIIEGGWPKVLTNFGNPFGDQITIPVKTNDVDGSESTTGFEGLKLFGNPYGLPISVDSLISELVKVDPLTNRYIYRWDSVNKRYELASSGAIKPYEAVFIRTITYGLDAFITLGYNDMFESVPAKNEVESSFQFVLKSSNGEVQSQSSIQFREEEALVGIDPFDGYYLGSYAGNYASLYTQVDDQFLTINNLPAKLNDVVEFPIYLDATYSGNFELEWNKEQLPKSMEFYLEEVSTGKIIDLKTEDKLSFTAELKAKINPDKEVDEERQKDTSLEKQAGAKVIVESSSDISDSVITSSLFPGGALKVKKGAEQSLFILTVNPLLSTDSESDLEIPKVVELEQNYPNPFNPTSVIQFGVPKTAKVKLEVFDILGRKVMTLVNNETRQAGRYNVEFDARNLASGMYIYRLVIGDTILAKKMTLIK